MDDRCWACAKSHADPGTCAEPHGYTEANPYPDSHTDGDALSETDSYADSHTNCNSSSSGIASSLPCTNRNTASGKNELFHPGFFARRRAACAGDAG